MIKKLTLLLSASTPFPLLRNSSAHEWHNKNNWAFINSFKATKLTPTDSLRSYTSGGRSNKLFTIHTNPSKQTIPKQTIPKQTIYSSILSEPACDSLPQQINWIIRDDFRHIDKIANRLCDDKPDYLNSEYHPKTLPKMTKSPRWPITPKQSERLLSELIDFYHQQFNFTNRTIFALDHALLLIKSNTTKEDIYQAIIELSGELGLQTFKQTTLEKSLHFPTHTGLILAVRPWQQQYITALLKALNVQTIVREHLNDQSLAGITCFRTSFQKIQKRLSTLQQAGAIQKHSWFTPALNRLIYNQVCSTICFERYHRMIPGPLPHSTYTSNHEPLLRLLKEPNMTLLAQEVAKAIEAGYISIDLLKDGAFRQLCHDLPGIDCTDINGGFAIGAQAFIHEKGYRDTKDEQRETDQTINIQQAGIILHEAVHALDWIKNPKRYISNLTNFNGTLTIEMRAYKEQRRLLHLHQAPFCFDSPDPNKISDDDFLKAVIIDRYWRPPT